MHLLEIVLHSSEREAVVPASVPLHPERTDASSSESSASSDAEAVWTVVTGMYAAHEACDREEVDARLDPEATMWHSEADGLLLGRKDLDRLRAERAAAASGPEWTGLDAHDPVVDVLGDTALVRYWLRVDCAPAADGTPLRPELVRNTAVLQRGGSGAWRIVHLHEEVRQTGGVPL
ncbi:nuclear transport factor 2 family protein [Streptoverticillium reticulum]|uniref:nuclear transport factor 2 family protein n=1 Tax=Streptoverticillium reticulum TaxID=1433415 RepID=UPI0039BFBAFC